MTKEEFKSNLHKMEKTTITTPMSLKESTEILVKFAGTCLSTKSGTSRTTEPSIRVEGEKVSLYLDMVTVGSFDANRIQGYIFLAQIWAGPNKSTSGEIYYTDSIFGGTKSVSERLQQWLKKEKKICPNIM